ncbi:glutathione S-transferase family protein [Phenylobacterium montanum]|uniref:glutathione transferase n=1 Tax=Phenylobacterium montanum TaxID=2823693 RepID=A0A975IUZ6_9CAUL|nr:glutathione S-transferase [Caulobacter sp. S6]QUD86776.1 glutathione S-transferase [Caulobacter sp. S6]
MLTIHHLNNSRSQRILWLFEELGLKYDIQFYKRDAATNLAPPELKAIHPLGKSPVITDGEIKIAESGAIVEYVLDKYGQGRLQPPKDSAAHWAHVEWLHYAEGSAMLPLMLNLYTMRLGEAAAPLKPRIDSEIDNHLAYVDAALQGRSYLLGEDLTGADIQMSFVGEVGKNFGRLGPFKNLAAYVERLHTRPAYKAALEKGGAYGIGQ